MSSDLFISAFNFKIKGFKCINNNIITQFMEYSTCLKKDVTNPWLKK